jgi:large subunit ribosomal protein L31
MKPYVHPGYQTTKVRCLTCGREFLVGSTHPDLQVEVCGHCHPFYTGNQPIAAPAGLVERFRQRLERAATGR